MKACPYCGYNNREGLLFCEECGQGLTDARTGPANATHVFEGNASDYAIKSAWGSASLTTAATIIVHIRDAADPLQMPLADQMILGRYDSTNSHQPDIDLTPYGALEKGVSRLHATIERNEDVLTLVDLNSSNGTHLNGQRLTPNQPRVLREGDEIQLGKLVAHIYFR